VGNASPQGDGTWALETEDLTVGDIGKFYIIRELPNNRTLSFANLSVTDLARLATRVSDIPTLRICIYGADIPTAPVQKLIKGLMARDRSTAPRDNEISRIAEQLQEKHGDQWVALDCVWSMWANEISKRPQALHASIINDAIGPPFH